ncbi:MAG: fumarylacetoacetate hydrolase family protein [Anaerolineae bacterium]
MIGVLEGDRVLLTTEADPIRLVERGHPVFSGTALPWEPLLAGDLTGFRLLAPIDPPEVWGYGFTYKRGPQFDRSPMIPKGPAYTAAIEAGRPEIFFKTTGFRVVGPNDAVGIRGDARYTAVEAELCIIVDEHAQPVLLTAGNDVSAWDIEAQNPLWLAQCKTYEACCALGPVAVTPDEIPGAARVRCRVLRGNEVLFDDSAALSDMHWSLQELAYYAAVYNPLPRGTTLMTGTAVIRPDAASLADGDVVETIIDGIGTLRNVGRLLTSRVPPLPYGFAPPPG